MMDNGYIELIPLSTTRHPIDSLKIVYKQHLYVDRGRQGDTLIGAARFLLSHDIEIFLRFKNSITSVFAGNAFQNN